MVETEVAELTSERQLREAHPVMAHLRPLEEDAFVALVRRMESEGYRLFGLYADGDMVALAGVRLATNLYHGRHAYVDDLVTAPERRSEGFGEEVLRHVYAWASDRDCSVVELASALEREDAHRFYEGPAGMERFCLTFTRRVG